MRIYDYGPEYEQEYEFKESLSKYRFHHASMRHCEFKATPENIFEVKPYIQINHTPIIGKYYITLIFPNKKPNYYLHRNMKWKGECGANNFFENKADAENFLETYFMTFEDFIDNGEFEV